MADTSRRALAAFEERISPNGRFLRFARARRQMAGQRHALTFLAAASVALLASPALGVLFAVMVSITDLIDSEVLHRIYRKYRAQTVPRSALRLAAATGALHAAAISAAISVMWLKYDMNGMNVFAATLLIASAFNTGIARPFFPLGSNIKLGIYVATGTFLLIYDAATSLHLESFDSAFMLVTVVFMAVSAVFFVRWRDRNQAESEDDERVMLEDAIALEVTREDLAATAHRAERLALAVQYARDSIIITNLDGSIEWVNDGFSRNTGYSFEEAVGKNPAEILNADETSLAAQNTLNDARRNGRPALVEILNRTRDGGRRWAEVSLFPVPGPDGKPKFFISVERDITVSKQQRDDLIRSKKMAEAAAEAKSQFLATMSHEIRTPLNGVVGVAELLQDTPLDATQGKYVQTIVDSGRALLNIVNDVLEMSKLERGALDVALEPFSVTACVEGTLDLLKPSALKKGLKVSFTHPDRTITHLGDHDGLRQIVLNLLSSAIKFTAAGEVSVKVKFTAKGAKDLVSIAVTDSGIGIAESQVAHIFESFAQADRAITRQFGGTGLGLTISQMLARRAGGDIQVKSKPGVGSTFTVLLHLPRAEPVIPVQVEGAEIPQTDIRLLVAEDNATNMMIIRELLARCVGTFVEATDGGAAVEAYKQHRPDLILMDISMPVMTGQQACREIRKHEAALGLPRCPIHALTAYISPDEAELCREVGMDGVLIKPPARADLYRLISDTAAGLRFDVAPGTDVDKVANGGPAWSTSPPESGTTSGKSIRSSGR